LWEGWLDDAKSWGPFFERVAAIKATDLSACLSEFGLVTADDVTTTRRLRKSSDGRSMQMPGLFDGSRKSVVMLALSLAKRSHQGINQSRVQLHAGQKKASHRLRGSWTSRTCVEVIDLMNNRVEGEICLGLFIAAFSAHKKAPPAAAMLVLGDLSVQGNIKGLRSLAEPLQLAMDNGAKRALIPLENKRSFLGVTGDVVEHADPIFFGDPKTAAFKALGLN
jgi:hypothetical protein